MLKYCLERLQAADIMTQSLALHILKAGSELFHAKFYR